MIPRHPFVNEKILHSSRNDYCHGAVRANPAFGRSRQPLERELALRGLESAEVREGERSLAPNGQLTIVGDPNQAIYAWRGASSSSFHDLIEKFYGNQASSLGRIVEGIDEGEAEALAEENPAGTKVILLG
jgi:hypothetical protein